MAGSTMTSFTVLVWALVASALVLAQISMHGSNAFGARQGDVRKLHVTSDQCAEVPLRAIRIACAPTDWICSSGLARRIAAKLTSDSGASFSFATKDEPPHCLVDHPVVYLSGYPWGFPRSSDLRVFINPESTSTFAGDLTISGVRDLPLKMKGSESTAVVYLPYLFFAVLQGSETDDRALIANGASQPQVGSRLFAAYATSHCGVEARDRIYTVLSEYKPLHYLNKECGKGSIPAPEGTMNDRGDETSWVDAVTRRLSHYKFAVVFENTIQPGYHTEKLALARKAGAVPVYYGSRHAHTLFNSSSFIDCSPQPRESMGVAFRRCKEQVIAVDKDDNKWREMVTAPFLRDNKPLDYGPLARLLRALFCSKTKSCPADSGGAVGTACAVLRGDGDPAQQAALKTQPSVADSYFVPAGPQAWMWRRCRSLQRSSPTFAGQPLALSGGIVGNNAGGSYLAKGGTFLEVFDGNTGTWMDVMQSGQDGGFAGIVLDAAEVVRCVQVMPRPGLADRLVGAVIQGMEPGTKGWAGARVLHTISFADWPVENEWLVISIPKPLQGPYAALRYVGALGANMNVAEVRFLPSACPSLPKREFNVPAPVAKSD